MRAANQRECEDLGKLFCDTNLCISSRLRCDSISDCADGKDELNCSKCSSLLAQQADVLNITVRPFCLFPLSLSLTCTLACADSEFQCANKQCISETLRCDGKVDCDQQGNQGSDASDEWSCCKFISACTRDQGSTDRSDVHVYLFTTSFSLATATHHVHASDRLDTNRVAQNFRNGIWLPICVDDSNERDATQWGNTICAELGYGSVANVSFVSITSSNISDCDRALRVQCDDYFVDLKSSGNNAKSPQEINSTLLIRVAGDDASSCKSQILSPIWLVTSYECLR